MSLARKDTATQEPESRPRGVLATAGLAALKTGPDWSRETAVVLVSVLVKGHRSPQKREMSPMAAAAGGTHIVDSSCETVPRRGTGAR